MFRPFAVEMVVVLLTGGRVSIDKSTYIAADDGIFGGQRISFRHDKSLLMNHRVVRCPTCPAVAARINRSYCVATHNTLGGQTSHECDERHLSVIPQVPVRALHVLVACREHNVKASCPKSLYEQSLLRPLEALLQRLCGPSSQCP